MTHSRIHKDVTDFLSPRRDAVFPVGDRGSLACASLGLDHILIRDMVVSCHVGVYSHEKENAQRVRVNIDLGVVSVSPAEDESLADVVCYEAMQNDVRALMQRGHIRLVETLASRIAEMCLEDRRVRVVRVRLEKLEAVPDAIVGVEIERVSHLPWR